MGGFNSIRGDEVIGYADNFSFDGTERGGKMVADGQLWIGSTSGRHVRLNTLTPGAGVSITNGSGTIQISVNGAVVGQTITGDTGGALSPTAGNWNILGQQAGSVAVMDTVGSAPSTLRVEDRTWPTQLVVDASTTVGLRGTFTTITLALAAAVSGQTIFIRSGTYTEDLTLKAGVNLVGFSGAGDTPQVTIIGNCTATFAGACSISNIRFQTNAAACLTLSGSNATIVNVFNCYFNCTNSTGIIYSVSNTSSDFNLYDCRGNLGTTGIAFFTNSSTGNMRFFSASFTNSGLSTTASTTSAAAMYFGNCKFTNAFSTSSSGQMVFQFCGIDCSGLNTTAITTAGTGSATVNYGVILSGSASAISVGTGTFIGINGTRIDSNNTNALTGAGSGLLLSGIMYTGASSKSNITTQTGGAINGITQGTAPSAGYVGEQIRTAGTGVSMTTATPKTIVSVNLTPGVWDVSCNFTGTATLISEIYIGISSNTNSFSSTTDGDNRYTSTGLAVATAAGSIASYRVTLATTTTYYLVAQLTATGTLAGNARISGTRVG